MINDLRDITSDKIAIGIVKSSHGLAGEVKVKAYTNYLSVFESDEDYLLYNKDKKRHLIAGMETIKKAGKNLIIKFDGFKSIEDANRISGFEIYVDLSRLPEIDEDQYYFYQLLDCLVVDENEKTVGRVLDIIETGSADVLSIFPEDADPDEDKNKEIMIPIIDQFILKINKEKKIIKVKLPKYRSSGAL